MYNKQLWRCGLNQLQHKVESVKRLLSFVGRELDNLSFETFDSVFPAALTAIKQVNQLKLELATEFGTQSRKIFEYELFSKAKQIEAKFDNIVEVFSEEEKKLERQLCGTIKQKKN